MVGLKPGLEEIDDRIGNREMDMAKYSSWVWYKELWKIWQYLKGVVESEGRSTSTWVDISCLSFLSEVWT